MECIYVALQMQKFPRITFLSYNHSTKLFSLETFQAYGMYREVTIIHYSIYNCDWLCKKGVFYMYQFCSFECICELLCQIFLSYINSNNKVLLANFKAIDQTQTELHIFKVVKSDACIRFLFLNAIKIDEL